MAAAQQHHDCTTSNEVEIKRKALMQGTMDVAQIHKHDAVVHELEVYKDQPNRHFVKQVKGAGVTLCKSILIVTCSQL